MRENHVYSGLKRKYKATTNSKYNYLAAPYLLNQDFKSEKPNQIWVGDITYIKTQEVWFYRHYNRFSKRIVLNNLSIWRHKDDR